MREHPLCQLIHSWASSVSNLQRVLTSYSIVATTISSIEETNAEQALGKMSRAPMDPGSLNRGSVKE